MPIGERKGGFFAGSRSEAVAGEEEKKATQPHPLCFEGRYPLNKCNYTKACMQWLPPPPACALLTSLPSSQATLPAGKQLPLCALLPKRTLAPEQVIARELNPGVPICSQSRGKEALSGLSIGRLERGHSMSVSLTWGRHLGQPSPTSLLH